MSDPFTAGPGLPRLLAIMERLRDPERGCPWDVEQTFASIAPYTLEEAHEVADAIAREDWDELRGELGDLLLQTVFHARMAEERGLFDFEAVAKGIADKMIARHPHVFGDASRDKSSDQQTLDWGADQGRRAGGPGAGGRARRGGARPSCPDAGREAAEAGRARGLRLALDRRGARQDHRGGARAGRGA